jgi:hypothetical protein
MIPALLLLTSCLALVPSAKADIFKYDVQFTQGTTIQAHVIFELPSFQETVDNQTTFDLATWVAGLTLNDFSTSGNSTACVVGLVSVSGPCAIFASFSGTNLAGDIVLTAPFVPTFSGPGTFTKSSGDLSTTVIIMDISAVPEPSAFVLLASCLLGVGLVVRKRRENSRP